MTSSESVFSIRDARGRQCSLLNEVDATPSIHQRPPSSKRRYLCQEPGCNKSFTTSGHLARHNRIHTGEKNFQCIYPGCPSRFSRQDNMMQHYRTHLSPKSKRHPYHQQYTHQPYSVPYTARPVGEKWSPQFHRHTQFHSEKSQPSPLHSLHQVCMDHSVRSHPSSQASASPPFSPLNDTHWSSTAYPSPRSPRKQTFAEHQDLPLKPYHQRHEIHPDHLNNDFRPNPDNRKNNLYQLASYVSSFV
ncbi:hypothetical protein DM01DRAFT_1386029, partial [Hesseltinella vesiculosa]